jgi:putative endonuclease
MAWYVYIAQARTGRYYTGITSDPKRRIREHNTHSGARMENQQGPFELVYVSAEFPTKSGARKREMQIKGWKKNKKQKLISGEWQ